LSLNFSFSKPNILWRLQLPNTNKGASSASHSATKEEQSNLYRRTLRRRVHVGENGSPGKSKSMVFSKDLAGQLTRLHSIGLFHALLNWM
jgi:hypothetical protein